MVSDLKESEYIMYCKFHCIFLILYLNYNIDDLKNWNKKSNRGSCETTKQYQQNVQEAVKLQNYIFTLFGEKKGKAPATMSTEVREGIRKKQEMQEEWRAEEITR